MDNVLDLNTLSSETDCSPTDNDGNITQSAVLNKIMDQCKGSNADFFQMAQCVAVLLQRQLKVKLTLMNVKLKVSSFNSYG